MDGGLDVDPAATPLTSFFFFFFYPSPPAPPLLSGPPPSTLPNPAPISHRRTAPFSFDGLSFRCVCMCVCQQTDGLRLWRHMASVSDTDRCATVLTLCALWLADGDVQCQRRQLSSLSIFGIIAECRVCSSHTQADFGVSDQPPYKIRW